MLSNQIVTAAFMNSGQICVALKRIYVHSSIYREFVQEMVNFTKSINVGDGFSETNESFYIGPIQNSMQFERVKGFIKEAEERGLTIPVGGSEAMSKLPEKGYFITPTLVDNPPDNERLVVEEPFGMSPFLSIFIFHFLHFAPLHDSCLVFLRYRD